MTGGGGGPDVDLEWALVAPGKVIVATPDRAWVHHPGGFGEEAFTTPMRGPGSVATTRRLLDGAVGAAQRARAEEGGAGSKAPPPMTPARWVWRLAGYYRTTTATPPLMLEAAARFEAMGESALARWAEEKAVEERGHDELALRDIRALGYDAEKVVERLQPKTALALARYFKASVRGEHPVGCVGYSYALERLALTRGPGFIDFIRSILPPGVDATRCLRVHSSAGTDARHVEETVLAVAALKAELRAQIALATYETTALCYLTAAEDFIAEDALKETLAMCASHAAPAPG